MLSAAFWIIPASRLTLFFPATTNVSFSLPEKYTLALNQDKKPTYHFKRQDSPL